MASGLLFGRLAAGRTALASGSGLGPVNYWRSWSGRFYVFTWNHCKLGQSKKQGKVYLALTPYYFEYWTLPAGYVILWT